MRKKRGIASNIEGRASRRSCSDECVGCERGLVADNGADIEYNNADKKDLSDGGIPKEPSEETEVLVVFSGSASGQSRQKDDDNILSFSAGTIVHCSVEQVECFAGTSRMMESKSKSHKQKQRTSCKRNAQVAILSKNHFKRHIQLELLFQCLLRTKSSLFPQIFSQGMDDWRFGTMCAA